METATLAADRVVDSSRGLDHIHIQGETHSHGKEGEHSHAGLDPHTWSDPLLYLQQAEAVHAALSSARPDKQAVFDGNLATVRTQLSDLDRKLKDALTPGKSVKLAANHPAYNYLARRYDLDIESFDIDPELVADEKARAAFIAWAETVDRPRHLLWEAQPTDAVRRSLPTGTIHIFIDPLEQPPDGQEYDYVRQAERNVTTFKSLFKKSSPPPSSEKSP
jgi:zinc transport system substrate-binding protein